MICFLLVAVPPVRDSTSAAPPPPPARFSTVFPNPSGQNGLEEIVAAADLVRDNAALDAAIAPDATLTLKRAALRDPNCRQALTLLRAGLAKPMAPPLPENDALAPGKIYRDLPLLRRLGSLLAVEEYVLAADGRISAAINTLEDALRLTDAVRGENVSAALYAHLIDEEATVSLARHMGQWALPDCDRILGLVQTRLTATPELDKRLLERWRRSRLAGVDALEAMPVGAQSAAALNPNHEASLQAVAESWLALGPDPALRHAAFDSLRQRINASFDRAEAIDPYAPAEPDDNKAPSAGPASAFVEAYTRATLNDPTRLPRSLARMQVALRLLAVQAAIRRYRWEFGRLPLHLEDLRLGDLSTDPYSGSPYRYTVAADGASYTLASIGPQGNAREAQGEIVVLPEKDIWR